MGGAFVKMWKMRGFCKKVENRGCFFVKKWTLPQRRVHYVQYQYFLFYIRPILIWRGCVRTQRTPRLPTGLIMTCLRRILGYTRQWCKIGLSGD